MPSDARHQSGLGWVSLTAPPWQGPTPGPGFFPNPRATSTSARIFVRPLCLRGRPLGTVGPGRRSRSRTDLPHSLRLESCPSPARTARRRAPYWTRDTRSGEPPSGPAARLHGEDKSPLKRVNPAVWWSRSDPLSPTDVEPVGDSRILPLTRRHHQVYSHFGTPPDRGPNRLAPDLHADRLRAQERTFSHTSPEVVLRVNLICQQPGAEKRNPVPHSSPGR